MTKLLRIATVQHPVVKDIETNCKTIIQSINKAKSRGAEIVHFSECNLSGYAGIDFLNFESQSSKKLSESLSKIQEVCRSKRISAIIGSHHFENALKKPFNSLYLIDNIGEIKYRYDKRHLTQAPETDYIYYSPGNEPISFDINGIKCGMLICHEWRYPEFYREYLKMGVEVIFQSFYDGGLSKEQFIDHGKELGQLIMGAMKGNAANNYMWISASNTSRPESAYPSFVLRPDGSFADKLNRNKPGILISEINLEKEFSDPSRKWRDRIVFGE